VRGQTVPCEVEGYITSAGAWPS